MKIRLPLPLLGKAGKQQQGINSVPSDDSSCASNASKKSSRSYRSFSRSRRTISESAIATTTTTTTTTATATSTATKDKNKDKDRDKDKGPPKSPTKKSHQQSPLKKSLRFKRLQKSCSAIINTTSGSQRRNVGSSSNNTLQSTHSTGSSVELSVDSTIVSVAGPDVVEVVTSSAAATHNTRPIPIKLEDVIGFSHTNTNETTTTTTTTPTKRSGTPKPTDNKNKNKNKNNSSSTNSSSTNITANIIAVKEFEPTTKMTKERGTTAIRNIKETIDDNDVSVEHDYEDEDRKYSPTSAGSADSLLPLLEDDNEEVYREVVRKSLQEDEDEECVSQKLLLSSIDQAQEIVINNNNQHHHVKKRNDGDGDNIAVQREDDEEEIGYGSKWAFNEKFVSNIGREIVHPNNNDACVASALTEGMVGSMGYSSCNSSLSPAKSVRSGTSLSVLRSFNYDSDEDITERVVPLANSNSTMVPPKEVVTITSGPLLQPSMTHHNSPKRQHNKRGGRITANDVNEHGGDDGYGYDDNNNITSTRNKNNVKNNRHDVVDDEKDDERKMAQELAVKLVRDLEAIREENERYASKNRRLVTQLQIVKAQQEEHMIHRGRLIKACLYTSPVFILCGGLDAFLSTILLVWVLVEVDNYLDLGDEAVDVDDDEDSDDEDFDDEASLMS